MDNDFVDLIEMALKNDSNAFNILIHSIEPEMYRIAKVRLKNDDDIYEAMQETIILIFKHLKKLKNVSFFRTWAMKILINECNKIYKKSTNDSKRCLECDDNIPLQDNSLENLESNLSMQKLLDCLNDSERLIMTLYYGNDFTTKEISNILQEPEGTIKSKISRSKIKIKEYIKEENIYE